MIDPYHQHPPIKLTHPPYLDDLEGKLPSHCFFCSEKSAKFRAEESWLRFIFWSIRASVFLYDSQLKFQGKRKRHTGISPYPCEDDGCFAGVEAMAIKEG
jgi:hypothetical protein